MTVPPARQYTLVSQATSERIPQIRRIVAAHLKYWRLGLHIHPVCRGIEALLGQAHRQLGDDNRCVVELRWTGRHLTASVEDTGPRLPRLRTAGGGGLAVLAALSDSWGTCGTTEGKVVWFTRSVATPNGVLRTPLGPVGGIGTAETGPGEEHTTQDPGRLHVRDLALPRTAVREAGADR